MAVHHVDLADRYEPKTQTENIIVSVKIGDGQVGAYSIFLDKELKTSNQDANLGNAGNVGQKDIMVVASIRDTLTQTNWTSMTVFIDEGNNHTKFGPYSVLAEKHIDTIIYTLKLLSA